jgi:hypothetical protein
MLVDGVALGDIVGSLDVGFALGLLVEGATLGNRVGLPDVGFELGLPVDGGALGDIVGSLDDGSPVSKDELGIFVDDATVGINVADNVVMPAFNDTDSPDSRIRFCDRPLSMPLLNKCT